MTTCALCELPVEDGVADTVERPESDTTDVEKVASEPTYCCRGCREVDALVDAEASPGDRPAPRSEPPDVPDDCERRHLRVDGMHCATCERYLEAVATDISGVRAARASYATERLTLWYDPAEVGATDLADAVSGVGYHVSAGDEPDARERNRLESSEYRAAVAAIVSMPVMSLYLLFVYPTYLGIHPDGFLRGSTVGTLVVVPIAVWTTLILVGLGYPIFRGAYVSLRVRQPNVDVLVGTAVLAAYGYSLVALALGGRHLYFDVVVMVLVAVTVGDHYESRLKREALATLDALSADRDRSARVLTDGGVETVRPDACSPGDRVVVATGERVPVDGTVVVGNSTVDESVVSGESRPLSKSPGDSVVGGSVVTGGPLELEVERTDGTLDRLVDRLRDVQSAAAGHQRLANRFAVAFVPGVVALAALTALAWSLLGAGPATALLVGVSVLVVSCPCSVGIATPLALVRGVRDATERGAAVLDAAALERLTDSDAVVFDKTGTLTTGEMRVRRVTTADATDGEVVRAAAAVESRATHPIADAVLRAAREAGTDPPVDDVSAFEREGRAVTARVEDGRVRVGHPESFGDGWDVPEDIDSNAEDDTPDATRVLVGVDGRVRGEITLVDAPRPEWDEVLETVADGGREVVVLTGDDERRARRFAAHDAVDRTFTGVRPASKAAMVDRLRREGTVTMVGDGTNDAPALAAADLGIALGSGTDLALDAADVAVLDDDLRTVPALFGVAAATRARVRTNLLWALGYNAVAIPLAVAGLVDPLIAAALMAASSLVVVHHSLRGGPSVAGSENLS